MAATTVPGGNTPGIVTATRTVLLTQQRLMRGTFMQFRINNLNNKTASC
jgi:hypothetical protein